MNNSANMLAFFNEKPQQGTQGSCRKGKAIIPNLGEKNPDDFLVPDRDWFYTAEHKGRGKGLHPKNITHHMHKSSLSYNMVWKNVDDRLTDREVKDGHIQDHYEWNEVWNEQQEKLWNVAQQVARGSSIGTGLETPDPLG